MAAMIVFKTRFTSNRMKLLAISTVDRMESTAKVLRVSKSLDKVKLDPHKPIRKHANPPIKRYPLSRPQNLQCDT